MRPLRRNKRSHSGRDVPERRSGSERSSHPTLSLVNASRALERENGPLEGPWGGGRLKGDELRKDGLHTHVTCNNIRILHVVTSRVVTCYLFILISQRTHYIYPNL